MVVKLYGRKRTRMTTPIQKLRLCDAKEGKRLEGKLMFAASVTHDQAQDLSNKGHASWFKWVDADKHPNPSERSLMPAQPIAPKTDSKAETTDKRDPRPKYGKETTESVEDKPA